MSEGERPRERLLSCGPAALSAGELLAVILRNGTRDKSVLDLSRELLSAHGGSLSEIAAASADTLEECVGIGPDKAAALMAAFELGRRFFAEESSVRRVPVTSPGAVYRMLLPKLKGLKHEESWVLYLNNSNYVLSEERLTVGSSDSTVISPREIIQRALEKKASGIILVHNHPGGNPTPSAADIRQTGLLQQAGNAFSISLLDHVVVCDNCYFSFSEDREFTK